MGDRKAGDDSFHADRDQVATIKAHVPSGDRLDMLAPELNVSGGLPIAQRPSLLAAVEGIEAGKYDGLIVAYLSRLGRNVAEQLRTYDRVHAAGGTIIVAQEGIDARTRGGRLQRNILAAIHEDEREQHVERFENLRRWATEAGVWQRRQTPRGYRKDPDTRHLVPDERAAEVRAAFEARGSGATITSIAERLRMTPGGVRALLRNRVYLGELKVGKHVNVAAHEPIVSRQVWEAAQVSIPRPPRSVDDGPALLAGLIRCAGCGHVMSRNRTKVVIYSCAGLHSGERCLHPASVTAALVDAHVEQIARAELDHLAVTASEGRGLEQAQRALDEAERELAAFLDGVLAAGLDAHVYAGALRARNEAVQVARDALTAEQTRAPHLPAGGSGAEVWADLDAHERNALLRSLLAAVVVARAGGRGARVPLADRVRVLRFGANLRLPIRRGGEGSGIVPIPLGDPDGPDVLGMPSSENPT